MTFRRINTLGWVMLLTLLAAASAHAGPGYGKLSGVVVDPSGTPQMGATILVLAEDGVSTPARQLLTNRHGVFLTDRLLPGLYSVRVTLAGFLPSMERHVRVSLNLTTLLRIELDSVFASLDRLRSHPANPTDADEWKWVLRTSANTRPVLQWTDGQVVANNEQPSAEAARQRRPRGRVELTSGARHPGSVSNLADSPATAFAYDQRMGRTSQLVLAGQISYERAAAAGISTLWLPSGDPEGGPVTSLVMRQSKLGPNGPTFRGVRLKHSSQLALGDRVVLHYGAEYVLVGLGPATSTLRPRAELEARLSPNWLASVMMAGQPWSAHDPRAGALETALGELDAFPAVLWRNGHPVLEGGWHEEAALERKLGAGTTLRAAGFRDTAQHVAVFGRGNVMNADFFQDFFSNGFLYDGGASNSWGTRVAIEERFSDDFQVAAVYAWAGVLAPEDMAGSSNLRAALETRYRHSLGARLSGRIPRAHTRIATSYKWVQGSTVSRQDIFGEAAYQLDPYLSFSVRQPLPSFFNSGRWEAQADFQNLLAQGYVTASGRDGRVVLVPAFRSFRGGVSFQF
ncbi:MAG TPA: carboxypeptidase-like regulatory domain-containing protein [Candidatus Acidoferrales bacterium]|nr:carboxypeptidase-like regulatory domain-containing protein [Candidatus Acidoferrales bacterium]